LGLAWLGGYDDTQIGDVNVIHTESVKPICYVDFRQIHWTKARVGVVDGGEDSPQRATKLHGLGRGQRNGLQIDEKE
jgi:hypothetical protein